MGSWDQPARGDSRPAELSGRDVVDDLVIVSLTAAVAASPDDVALRLHLAELLLAAGRAEEAVTHCASALARQPELAWGRELMRRALTPQSAESAEPAEPAGPAEPAPPTEPFDWAAAETEVDGVVPPMFVTSEPDQGPDTTYAVAATGVRLSDVGGMDTVKRRLEAAFLAPLRNPHNPELRRLYGKSLRGGLLLYGPPGCGKTFLARAVAGELGASFLSVSLADVLDMYVGNSEKNVHELFETARSSAPCVLFLDELDALGQRRSLTRHSGMRTTVNQLLTELDGVASANEGVFVLAATNHPWDVDPALRRPGRLDRTLLVLPPDRAGREAVLAHHLRDRPLERVDVGRLARLTEGYSGADLAHLCDSAAETALIDSVTTGTTRMIGMADLECALSEVRPSVGPWVETARNVALFANESGEYDELAAWIRRQKRP